MLWSPAMFVGLGALAGIVPAFKAYRTDVASNLTPHS
jgi:putative ABC transport system permease protein